MKQVIQNFGTGETQLVDVPVPACEKGTVLIATRYSLISAGTERMLVSFGRANLIEKARQQPQRVQQVVDKVLTDGLAQTVEAVRTKLDQPVALGYSNVGIVTDSRVAGFSAGDRVVSNGPHAEYVRVPGNLCARVPDSVSDEAASFTVVGAIALQGVRLANPTIGESIAVFGLGLVGLLTVQVLKANGCRVLGIDIDPARCELARQFGAEVVDLSKKADPKEAARAYTRGTGIDGVIITASAKGSDLVHQAAEMCRKRGRIILVGVVGLDLRREDFYEKELTFQVSASYGPGRYDPAYEEEGHDYPVGFVRWTEQRNFEAVLDLLAAGKIDVGPLITHRFELDEALRAYDQLIAESSLGTLLRYSEGADESRAVTLPRNSGQAEPAGKVVAGFLGAGNYASRVLIPAFKQADARLDTVVTSTGMNAIHHGGNAGFRLAATDVDEIWRNEAINTVVVATRHSQHAGQVIEALQHGKHVFVEKPLALQRDELDAVHAAYIAANEEGMTGLSLMVGFNRRFAPLVQEMKSLLDSRSSPKAIVITVNAGAVPADHWIHDPVTGGGRIVGEACHFIDLARFLAGEQITGYAVTGVSHRGAKAGITEDAVMTLSFADGSLATIQYLSNGHARFPKERIEVFCGGAVLQLENFKRLKSFGWPVHGSGYRWRQDKGQYACVDAFVQSIETGAATPIPADEIFEVSRISIEIGDELRGG